MVSRTSAREIINKLQRHQAAEIQCLKELYELDCDDLADGETYSDVDQDSDTETIASSDILKRDQDIIPTCWDQPWTDKLLQERVREFCEDLCKNRSRDHSGCADPTLCFIQQTAPSNLQQFTMKRDPGSTMEYFEEQSKGHMRTDFAFYVADYDLNGTYYDVDGSPFILEGDIKYETIPLLYSEQSSSHLFKSRSSTEVYTREICINSFTPSAIAAVLLVGSSVTDISYSYECLPFDVMCRHLSTKSSDRFHFISDAHSKTAPFPGPSVFSFSITYFSLSEEKPDADENPLMESGKFGSAADGRPKYIREDKLTMSELKILRPKWETATRLRNVHSELAIIMSPLYPFWGASPNSSIPKRDELGFQLWNFLNQVWTKWDEVLNELDRQTTITSKILFDESFRGGMLFEDGQFTNSKRYFWALQSLRLFDETIINTQATLNDVYSAVCSHADPDNPHGECNEDWMNEHRKIHSDKCDSIGRRIKRKKDELQSLSDGLFAASSVIESRIAAEQNSHIRLLTLATIAFLPPAYVSSLYGMDVMPHGASFVSFIIVSIVLSLITFFLISNINNLESALGARERAEKMQQEMHASSDTAWKRRGDALMQAGKNRRVATPVSTWWYLGFGLHKVARWFRGGRDQGKTEGVPV